MLYDIVSQDLGEFGIEKAEKELKSVKYSERILRCFIDEYNDKNTDKSILLDSKIYSNIVRALIETDIEISPSPDYLGWFGLDVNEKDLIKKIQDLNENTLFFLSKKMKFYTYDIALIRESLCTLCIRRCQHSIKIDF